ncbi:MAG: hypothetical protein R3F62_26570 [Planctomycetota bacterium]
MRRLAALTCVCLALTGAARAQEAGAPVPAVEREAEALLRQLQDPELRDRALERLSQLGPRARPALQRAVHDPDPDVRFNALYLLELEGLELQRSMRVIVAGENADAGTYPEARQAFLELLGGGDDPAAIQRRADLRGMLVRYVLRQVQRRAWHYVSVALDVLTGLLEVDRERLDAAQVEALARLLDVDLGPGVWDLPRVFGAPRWEQALPVLRSRISGGSPEVAARAALALGECAPGTAGVAALEALGPGLKHRAARVRYACVRAVGKLDVPDAQLLPWVALTRDPHPRVAAAMLRVGAERRLSVVREPAEQWAADPQTPSSLRLTAVICLGMLQQGSPELLGKILEQSDGELALAAAWALGATGAKDAPARILSLARRPHLEREDALYAALGRSGTADALLVLRQLEGVSPAQSLFGYGRMDDVPEAVAAIMRFGTPPRRLFWLSAAESLSVLYARRSLEADPEPIRVAMARLYLGTRAEDTDRDQILTELRRVGAPAQGAERERLIQSLVERCRSERSVLVPPVLAQIAPEEARRVLAPLLGGRRYPGEGDWYLREVARALAIAGDSSYVVRYALPYSQRELAEASPDNRSNVMNNVGIDYLYARDLEQAALTFRQMVWCDAEDNIAAYNLACGAALGGDVDAALLWLRRSLRNGYTNERHIRSDSDLDLLHGDPRFERTYRRLLLRGEVRMPFDAEDQGDW